MKIQEALLNLERRVAKLTMGTTPGTQLIRCLVVPENLPANVHKDCPNLEQGDSALVWALHLGPMGRRGRTWYGKTVQMAIRNAQRDLAEVEKNWVGASPSWW